MKEKTMIMPPRTPSLIQYLRTGGKIGAFAGLGVALLYSMFTGVILFFIADLVAFPVGEIIDFVATIVCSGIGYFVGMLCGFIVWRIVSLMQ